jgi:Arc/MetJ family transcription regulator
MTTITLDDAVINEVIAVSHIQDAQAAVSQVLRDYLQQLKKAPPLFEQLRLADDLADDNLALLWERDKDMGRDMSL